MSCGKLLSEPCSTTSAASNSPPPSRSGTILNLTADARTLDLAAPHVAEFLSALPDGARAAAVKWSGSLPRINEALTVPTQV